MSELIEEFEVRLKFQVTVDPETGEVVTNCVKKSIDKSGFKSVEVKDKPKTKKIKNESSNPELILEDNKYCLNHAAIELIEVEPNDKLDISYKKKDGKMVPVIYKDDKKGNKITKSLTVACRGSKHDELSNYGSRFDIVPSSETGIFYLKGEDSEIEEGLDKDEDDVIDSVVNDIDIQDLLNDEDANIHEISSFEYQL